jgi:hypothetical protein
MDRRSQLLRILALALLAGCRGDEPRLAQTPPDTTPPLGEVVTRPPQAAGLTPEVRRREADELDRQVMELRRHIATMRQISPAMAGTLMEEHASHVRAIAERVRAQREQLPVDDEVLQQIIGMNPDEYRVLLEEVELAGAEVAVMRRADEDAVARQLPGHLDRLERISGQLEHAAAALRR